MTNPFIGIVEPPVRGRNAAAMIVSSAARSTAVLLPNVVSNAVWT